MLTPEQIRVREVLIGRAKRGRTISYKELCEVAKLPYDMTNPSHRELIGNVLGDLSLHEHYNGRPIISSIVISKSGGMPGAGIFSLGEYLEWDVSKIGRDKWWIDRVNETFEFWKEHCEDEIVDDDPLEE